MRKTTLFIITFLSLIMIGCTPKEDSIFTFEHTHIYADATCTEPATCPCGKTTGTPLGHDWTLATCMFPSTCYTCNATSGNKTDHIWKSATCTSPSTCQDCGSTNGTALGHKWTSATCTTPKKCQTCGTTSGTSAGHKWIEATYTSPKRCSTCSITSGKKLEAVITGISVATAKTTYAFGESFDVDSLSIYVHYSDGSFITKNGSYCDVTGFSSATLGENTVQISYDDKYTVSLNLNIIVSDTALTKISPFKKTNSKYIELVTDVYDSYGNYYDKCYEFSPYTNKSASLTYRLAGNFNRFTGTIALPKYTNNAIFKIYADDVLIYSKDQLKDTTSPFQFDVDISGCNFLKIEVSNSELLLYNGYFKK